MSDEDARQFLQQGFCGRLGTVGEDGYPYVVPLLYVCMGGKIYVHNTRAIGHLRMNVDHNPKVCFEVDRAGDVFPYGRFECDTSVSYRSVVVFGQIRVTEDREEKSRFCNELMRKYADPAWDRPREFYPRLDLITVYVIEIERMTGKETPLPEVSEQWPATDRTRTPDASPV
jgi:uncharacterized protein